VTPAAVDAAQTVRPPASLAQLTVAPVSCAPTIIPDTTHAVVVHTSHLMFIRSRMEHSRCQHPDAAKAASSD
jgi:hypothetical protein